MVAPSRVHPFRYAPAPHERRHGPWGYHRYDSYRDWLRDEFSFRCVFCLRREQWDINIGAWDIDHFVPQSQSPGDLLNYINLLYVCHACNLIKSDLVVPDPCCTPMGECLLVQDDGSISALDSTGQLLIDVLRLDSEDHTRYRGLIIRTLDALFQSDYRTYELWMSYPDDLPDLSRLRPPGNTKPEGVGNSHHARRARGELPAVYET